MSEDVYGIIEIKNTVRWTYFINEINGEEVIGTFYRKKLQKTNQEEFTIKKIIIRKGNTLYAKWKGYNNSFNNWNDKNESILS